VTASGLLLKSLLPSLIFLVISLILGHAKRKGLEIPVNELMQHEYVIGATGTGKSTLLANQAVQAFESGACCVVIDPHGDLALDVARAVNPGNLDRVYFLDPLRVHFSLNSQAEDCWS